MFAISYSGAKAERKVSFVPLGWMKISPRYPLSPVP
jgi:hypothetical protein